MKLALLMSNGETVALASRIIAAGSSACIAEIDSPLPSCDWLLFDESFPLSSPEHRKSVKRLLGEALSGGKPAFAVLTPGAPVTPKCALAVNEMLMYASALATTPTGAADILGMDGDTAADPSLGASLGEDLSLLRMGALARETAETHELSFVLIYDPEAERGVFFAGGAYDAITVGSFEDAIAEIFRPEA